MAQTHPDAIAIQDGKEKITYKALNQAIENCCSELHRIPLSRIALNVQNNTQSITLIFSFFRLQIITLLLNPKLSRLETEKTLKRSKIDTLFSDDLFLKKHEKTSHTNIPFAAPLSIICSSGSTGEPKLLVHSALNHLASATASQEKTPLNIGDRWGLSLPLHHVSGLSILWRCFQVGATVVLPPKTDPLPYFLQNCTHLSLVPTQVQDLLALDTSTTHLKHILVGGAACPEGLLEEGKRRGLPLQATYGLSEMSSQVCTQALDHRSLETLGDPLPGIALQLSKTGSILLKGPSLFLGYLQEDGAIDTARNENGWFQTNDRGILTDTGLKLLGRQDRCFISGGENIDPLEIELLLLTHPSIKSAHIIPIEDPRFGHCPAAIILPKGPLLESDIKFFLSEKLVAFKHPKSYRLLSPNTDLPPKPSLETLKRFYML